MDKDLLLYNYFSNQLTVEQQHLFEELLKTDIDFKKQFDFENNLKGVIIEKENENLKAKLRGFEKEIESATPVRKLPGTNYRKWAMAASIALLVGLGWLGYNNFSGPDYENLYRENFQEYPNTVYAITRGESVESIERKAFTDYELGNYESAIGNFKRIPQSDKKGYVDFYLGLSYLNSGQLDEAKKLLVNTGASNEKFKAETYWYLALIAIKENNKKTAVEYLNELVSQFDYNKDKAQRLLKELE